MKKVLSLSWVLFVLTFNQKRITDEKTELNKIAVNYVKLGLTIGRYDPDFVTTYYGPDSLKSTKPISVIFPKDSLLHEVEKLRDELKIIETSATDTNLRRARWMSDQLLAYSRRVRNFSGDFTTFDVESKELFGVVAPVYSKEYYKNLVAYLDKLLPGRGTVRDRFNKLSRRFIIPKNKLDTIFKVAIAESRRRTLLHYKLPVTENLKLEFVTHKPWTGYNLYQGEYRSVIQVNTDLPIVINQAIDLGSHETYPGHHVFNILHERKLYQDKGLLEVSIYPLFSPETLIAEGTAEYGIELAFPGDEKIFFTKNILLPLAGLDSSGITTYFKTLDILNKLNYTRNDAAKGIIDGTMSTKEAITYLGGGDGPKQQIEFTKKFRSYVITYNYGADIVKNYFERKLGTNSTTKERWDLYEMLLSDQVLIADLLEK